ncbi:hypothetical protein [Anabaena sp. AL09]|uniref:hypothetical protein n=1 Tax=Anabaena sp. AL09 TaxID=1710891 RepID=UPI00260A4711|nr:hypothetical protein [Anabaena sp. AL09]
MKITDSMFSKTLADISANNTLYFTPKQLLYFLDNRVRKKAFQPTGFWFSYLFWNVWVTGFVGGFTAFIPNSFLIFNLVYQAVTIWYLWLYRSLYDIFGKISLKPLHQLDLRF